MTWLRCPRLDCAGLLDVPPERMGELLRCPSCGREARFACPEPESAVGAGGRLPLEALLDNVRSLWNVGSIFRSADGAGVRHLHLTGVTGCPPRPEIAKTALGAERYVEWSHAVDPLERARALRSQGVSLWALESEAEELLDRAPLPPPPEPICLIVGNEVAGTAPALLALADARVRLPMRGTKRSLNVAVAFGIAAFELGRRLADRDRPEGPTGSPGPERQRRSAGGAEAAAGMVRGPETLCARSTVGPAPASASRTRGRSSG